LRHKISILTHFFPFTATIDEPALDMFPAGKKQQTQAPQETEVSTAPAPIVPDEERMSTSTMETSSMCSQVCTYLSNAIIC